MTEIDTYDNPGGSMPVITGGHLTDFMDWAKVIAVGSTIPQDLRGKPADVLITVLHGLDLGLRPMQALNLVYVVKGRPSLSAEGMRALLLRDGHEFEVVESTDKKAVVRGRRKGSDTWHEASFTDEQRRRAKLGGANWDAYPEDMLVARATTRLCKRFFSDVTGGLPSTEEILDNVPQPARPNLAQAAAARQAATQPTADANGVVEGEVVDDEAEAERIRQELAAIEQDSVGDEEPLDEATLPVEDNGWPEVAKPGSKAGAR